MDIAEQIASIEIKYGLNNIGEGYGERVKKEITKILNQIPEDKTVAIRGAGEHTEELLSLEGCNTCVKYIFDYAVQKKETMEIAGRKFDIYPCSDIGNMDIDIIIISSYSHRKEIRRELEKYKKNFIILDLYDALKDNGLDVNAPFYRNASDTYENVIYYRKKYFEKKNYVNTKNLAIAYLKIFDFINFEKFAKEYIVNKYPDYQDIQFAMDEIMNLLDCVKEKIKKRTQRDIITIWNDQLDYSYLKYTPYIQEVSRNSMFFENAYTMTPFTMATFLGMFQRLKSIDDDIYYKPFPIADSSNSYIINELMLSGYEFVYIGDEGVARMFGEKYSMTNYACSSSCLGCINLLQKLLDINKPVCVVLHASVETHNPYLSGELDEAKFHEWPTFGGGTEEEALEQKKKSAAYWDKQLEFYMGFMPGSSIKIFMSDHGTRYNIQPIYKEPTTHIIFFITGSGVPEGRYKRMFSIYDFYKVIHCILKNNYDEEEIFSDYVLIQETSIFNRTAIRYYIENNTMESSCAFRAVRTEKELYVKLSSGKRYYYLLPDEELNCIDKADRDRIRWLDNLAGDKFTDLSQYEKEIEDFRKQFETHE